MSVGFYRCYLVSIPSSVEEVVEEEVDYRKYKFIKSRGAYLNAALAKTLTSSLWDAGL